MSIGHFGPERIEYDNGSGDPAIGAQVSVVVSGTQLLAPLVVSSTDLAAGQNPVLVDGLGNLEFWTASFGEYDILINGARIPITAVATDTGAPDDPAEVFDQITPAMEWNFNHSLMREPVVAVYVDGVEQMVLVDATSTHVTITFTQPTAGRAILT